MEKLPFNRENVREFMRTNSPELVTTWKSKGKDILVNRLVEFALYEFKQFHNGGPIDKPKHWIWSMAKDIVDEVSD